MIQMERRPRSQRRVTNMAFLVLGVAGVVLETIGFSVASTTGHGSSFALSMFIFFFGAFLVAFGCAFYATGKKRSAWFGLLGLLSPIGLIFIAVLEDRLESTSGWDDAPRPQKQGAKSRSSDDFTPYPR